MVRSSKQVSPFLLVAIVAIVAIIGMFVAVITTFPRGFSSSNANIYGFAGETGTGCSLTTTGVTLDDGTTWTNQCLAASTQPQTLLKFSCDADLKATYQLVDCADNNKICNEGVCIEGTLPPCVRSDTDDRIKNVGWVDYRSPYSHVPYWPLDGWKSVGLSGWGPIGLTYGAYYADPYHMRDYFNATFNPSLLPEAPYSTVFDYCTDNTTLLVGYCGEDGLIHQNATSCAPGVCYYNRCWTEYPIRITANVGYANLSVDSSPTIYQLPNITNSNNFIILNFTEGTHILHFHDNPGYYNFDYKFVVDPFPTLKMLWVSGEKLEGELSVNTSARCLAFDSAEALSTMRESNSPWGYDIFHNGTVFNYTGQNWYDGDYVSMNYNAPGFNMARPMVEINEYCVNDTHVAEFYCPGSNSVWSLDTAVMKIVECPTLFGDPTWCENGRCVGSQEPVNCTDSDTLPGQDWREGVYTRGYVKYGLSGPYYSSPFISYNNGTINWSADNQSFNWLNSTRLTSPFNYSVQYDYCENSTTLREHFCFPSNLPSNQPYTCPNGCDAGACVPES